MAGRHMKNKSTRYVLVMEDNPAHAELLTEILDRHFAPIIIHTVDNIGAGFKFLGKTDYDLILTDSVVNEEPIAEHLKNIRTKFKTVPLIVITGSGNESLAAQLTRRGAMEYLVKTRETLDALPSILAKYL